MKNALEQKVGSLEKKVGSLDKRVGALGKKVGTLGQRMDSFEIRMEKGFEKIDKKFDQVHLLIEDLAIAVKNGFDEMGSEMVTKSIFEEKMLLMDGRFEKIEYRLDRIENISVGGHERRIENLEDKVAVINTKIGLKKNY